MSSKGNVALSDFGCSKIIMHGDDTLDRCNGTPAFLAPEMMRPNSKYRYARNNEFIPPVVLCQRTGMVSPLFLCSCGFTFIPLFVWFHLLRVL